MCVSVNVFLPIFDYFELMRIEKAFRLTFFAQPTATFVELLNRKLEKLNSKSSDLKRSRFVLH